MLANNERHDSAPVRVRIKAPAQTDINFDTILAEIRAASIGSRDEEINQRVRKLKRAAVQEFARLNGWVTGPKVWFPPQAIGPRNRTNHSMEQRVLDHCTYYRVKGRNAAIVSEPYAPDCRDHAARLATKLGLELHVPPNPRASIWSPGDSFFLVFTAPGHVMRWLPEQLQP